MPDFYYTPGWGALATATVAIVALIYSNRNNKRTLTQSAAQYERTTTRAYEDNLRSLIADYHSALGELKSRGAIYAHRITKEAQSIQPGTSLEDFRNHLKAIFSEELSECYRRVTRLAFTVLILSDDPKLAEAVRQLIASVAEDRIDNENLLKLDQFSDREIKQNPDRESARAQMIEKKEKFLIGYCLQRWRPPGVEGDVDLNQYD